MNFTIPGKAKNAFLALIGVGIISLVVNFLVDPDRAWSNLLINAFWYTTIALAGTFFIAVHYVGEGGWHTAFKRVPEAMSQYFPIGALFLLVVTLAGYLHLNHTWHWLDPEFQANDVIYNSSWKSTWLNNEFWLARILVYLAGWFFFINKLRGFSLKEDIEGGMSWHKKSYQWSAAFLVFFAVTSSTSAWDFLMSIDPHWFSTLYGWYVFAGFWVSALTFMLLITVYLKKNGYLPNVNQSHIHDLAKMMFAFSIFWTYLWFSQYMLIWYSNIPEEINYFLERFHTPYKPLMLLMLVCNFVFPLIVLMHRDAKRNYNLVMVSGAVILLGHLMDLFQMVMPGSLGRFVQFGLMDIGVSLGFLGLFLFFTFRALASAPLTAQNHPFLGESKHHAI